MLPLKSAFLYIKMAFAWDEGVFLSASISLVTDCDDGRFLTQFSFPSWHSHIITKSRVNWVPMIDVSWCDIIIIWILCGRSFSLPSRGFLLHPQEVLPPQLDENMSWHWLWVSNDVDQIGHGLVLTERFFSHFSSQVGFKSVHKSSVKWLPILLHDVELISHVLISHGLVLMERFFSCFSSQITVCISRAQSCMKQLLIFWLFMITDEGSFIIIRVFFLPQVSIFQGSFSHTAEFSSSHWIYYCDIATTLGMNSWKEGKTILMDAEWRTFQEGNWRSFYYWSWVFSSSFYGLQVRQKIIMWRTHFVSCNSSASAHTALSAVPTQGRYSLNLTRRRYMWELAMWRRRKISFSKWWSAAIPPQPSLCASVLW